MKRIRLLILLFAACVSIPLAYVVARTYRGLAEEERATLRFFSDTLFDEMEKELSAMVGREESRAVDEYRPTTQSLPGRDGKETSSLSHLPEQPFILGYFQNNPDGSFQTPLSQEGKVVSGALAERVIRLRQANEIFNRLRFQLPEFKKEPADEAGRRQMAPSAEGFAAQYLDFSRSQKSKSHLGRQEKRVEEVPAVQALGLESAAAPAPAEKKEKTRIDAVQPQSAGDKPKASPLGETSQGSSVLQVEVDPLQSVFLTDDEIFFFRRIIAGDRTFRQGFVLGIEAFLDHLVQTHFISQPMAGFTGLILWVAEPGRKLSEIRAGAVSDLPAFELERSFPAPFRFLKAKMTCARIPSSQTRKTLNLMVAVLTAVLVLGLGAIYRSVRAVVELSERRSRFVSSVTHELKTPLTNIRMYVEMLEQGVAADPQREEEYFRILGSECGRLTRLIHNVLELSKLEKRQLAFTLQEGTFEEVIHEVEALMLETLRKEGFALKVVMGRIAAFPYDREAMVQVLINLLENSVKFGKDSPVKRITLTLDQEKDRIKIRVSDTGPGIPSQDLKRVFDDFYRADTPAAQNVRGTGIGLALVRRLVSAMGGSVSAENNDGPGCTVTVALPASASAKLKPSFREA